MAIAPPSGRSRRPRAAGERAADPLRLRDGSAVWMRPSGIDDGSGERAELVAVDGAGQAIGRAAYERVYGPRADLGIAVDAGFWHLGLPEALVAGLCLHAAQFGITTFLARVRAADVRLLAMLREHFDADETRDGAHVTVEFSTALVACASTTDP